jgi:hypothetical protein
MPRHATRAASMTTRIDAVAADGGPRRTCGRSTVSDLFLKQAVAAPVWDRGERALHAGSPVVVGMGVSGSATSVRRGVLDHVIAERALGRSRCYFGGCVARRIAAPVYCRMHCNLVS